MWALIVVLRVAVLGFGATLVYPAVTTTGGEAVVSECMDARNSGDVTAFPDVYPTASQCCHENARSLLCLRTAVLTGGRQMSETRPPLPPFDADTARVKVLAAEAAWNSRDPERVAAAYTVGSEWRNRDEFLLGRDEIRAFLERKWARELDYALRKDLWAFEGNRIAVRFQYEWHDAEDRWFRSFGNENWEFDDAGLMRRREASINDVPIDAGERRIFGPRAEGDVSGIPLR